MKKITSLLLVVFMAMTTYNVAYAAFPVQTEKTEKGKFSVEKITVEKNTANAETKEAAAPAAGGGKSQLAAGILCWLLGNFGVHDFYLGNTSKALMKLGLFVVGLALYIIGIITAVNSATTGSVSIPILGLIGLGLLVATWIWTLIDLIRIIMGNYPGL